MAVNWNALQTPNFAAAYGQGVEFREARQDREYQRQRDVVQDQRVARQDQMEQERFGFQKEQYQAERKDKAQDRLVQAIPRVAKIIPDEVQDEATWTAWKSDPYNRTLWDATAADIGLPGQLDTTPYSAVKRLRDTAARLSQTNPELIKGDDGELGTWDGKSYTQVRAPMRRPKGQWMERTVDAEGRTELVWVEEPGFDAPAAPPAAGTATQDTNGNAVPPPPAPPAVDLKDGVTQLTKIGARVTSGYRDPAHNARVGGVSNSYHTRGSAENPMAYDLVPPQGMSMAQLAAEAKRALPGYDVINEGDHVHIEPSSVAPYQVAQAGGTPPPPSRGGRSMSWDAPQAAKREAAPSGYQWAADGTLAPIKGGPADPAGKSKDSRKAEADLRKEFNARPEVKDYRSVATSFRQIEALAKTAPSAANDMSLIFSYMKMLDPGSVVREGEFANAQNSAGIPDRVRNAYNKALNGQRLNPNQRAEFTSSARTIYQTQERRFGEIATEYRGYAQDYGVDPNRVASVQQAAATTAQKPGDFSAQQRATAQRLAKAPNFKKLPVGSQGRPYAPRTEAEFKAIKPGGFYIDDDGKVYQKGR